MNPYELERLAKQHTEDLRETAVRHHAAAARRDRTRSIRHRTGWALVQIGLSLVSSSANGNGNGTARWAGVTSARPAR